MPFFNALLLETLNYEMKEDAPNVLSKFSSLLFSFYDLGDCCFRSCLHWSWCCCPDYCSACDGDFVAVWKLLDNKHCNNSWRSYSTTYLDQSY